MEENKEKKMSLQEWSMHYRQIIILLVSCLVALGIYGLANINKNEFPDFTIRQGIVVAVYPGVTAQEMEEQVTKPLEKYIFTYKGGEEGEDHIVFEGRSEHHSGGTERRPDEQGRVLVEVQARRAGIQERTARRCAGHSGERRLRRHLGPAVGHGVEREDLPRAERLYELAD